METPLTCDPQGVGMPEQDASGNGRSTSLLTGEGCMPWDGLAIQSGAKLSEDDGC